MKRIFLVTVAVFFCVLFSIVNILKRPNMQQVEFAEDKTKKETVIRSPEDKIRSFLGLNKEDSIRKEIVSYKLPFVNVDKKELLVVDYTFDDFQKVYSLELKCLFNSEGQFLRLETKKKLDDPFRMEMQEIEKQMKLNDERVLEHLEIKMDIDLKPVLHSLHNKYDIENLTEMDVNLVKYQFKDGTVKIIFICNLWGITCRIPARIKNKDKLFFYRRSVFMDLKGNILIASNLL